jgi:hypothetical protein
MRLQTKERENEEEREKDRNDQKRTPTGKETADDGHKDDAQDRKGKYKASASFSVLNKDCGAFVPRQGVEGIFIQGLRLALQEKVLFALIRVGFDHFFFQNSNARDGCLSRIDQTAQGLTRENRCEKNKKRQSRRLDRCKCQRSSRRLDRRIFQRSHLAVPHFEKNVDQVLWLFFPPDFLGRVRRVHDKSHLVQWLVLVKVNGRFPVYANLLCAANVRAMVIGRWKMNHTTECKIIDVILRLVGILNARVPDSEMTSPRFFSSGSMYACPLVVEGGSCIKTSWMDDAGPTDTGRTVAEYGAFPAVRSSGSDAARISNDDRGLRSHRVLVVSRVGVRCEACDL